MATNPLSNLDKYEVLLASNSPRRRQLLSDLGVTFRSVALSDIDESYPSDTPALDVAIVVARKKAEAYNSLISSNQLIITADTVVICDGIVLGKPADIADACRMLRMLSGKTHHVVTGVTVSTASRTEAFKAVTEVDFAPLSDDEIRFYTHNYRPLDKAGAYGIQEWIGCAGISGIRGSFYNVMGLPLHRLYTVLATF